MTFLPIVERELRVASRRRFTYWSRLVASGFLLGIFGMILTLAMTAGGMKSFLGMIEFAVLKWTAFVFAACVGIFLTSDSLSEEKREGTLGLLFLTDLRGFDVVLGKLISQSLQAFYGFLAALPILALPIMVGGVTGIEFGRSMLVLCNTLFFSLSIGLLVSSMSREVIKAMNAAFLLMFLFLVLLPWADFGLANWDSSKWNCVLSIVSPGYLFYAAGSLWPQQFWTYIGLQHLLAWSFLVLACLIVPRAWHEKSSARRPLLTRWFSWLRYGSGRARVAFRRKLLEREPVLWLTRRDRWLPRFVLGVTLVALGLLGCNVYVNWRNGPLDYFSAAQFILTGFMVLWMGSQACRFFLESVRNGAMELMLVTPVTPRQIVRSQWKALFRAFFIPLLVLLSLESASDIHNVMLNLNTPNTGPGGANHDYFFNLIIQQVISLASGLINIPLLMTALAWFGMWMGIKNRKAPIAVLKTILLVCIFPLLLEWFAVILTQIFSFKLKLPNWSVTVLFGGMEFVKNIFFIVWARWKLLTKFRQVVSEGGQLRRRRWGVFPRPAALATAPRPLIT